MSYLIWFVLRLETPKESMRALIIYSMDVFLNRRTGSAFISNLSIVPRWEKQMFMGPSWVLCAIVSKNPIIRNIEIGGTKHRLKFYALVGVTRVVHLYELPLAILFSYWCVTTVPQKPQCLQCEMIFLELYTLYLAASGRIGKKRREKQKIYHI